MIEFFRRGCFFSSHMALPLAGCTNPLAVSVSVSPTTQTVCRRPNCAVYGDGRLRARQQPSLQFAGPHRLGDLDFERAGRGYHQRHRRGYRRFSAAQPRLLPASTDLRGLFQPRLRSRYRAAREGAEELRRRSRLSPTLNCSRRSGTQPNSKPLRPLPLGPRSTSPTWPPGVQAAHRLPPSAPPPGLPPR